MASALDGITVLDLTQGAAGAMATMFLSDHGARVIRIVDADDREPRRGGFLVWDRGKEALRLSLADPGAAFEELVRAADVLVEDLAPSSPRRSLVERARLARLNPRLVSCSITAYGLRGRLKDEPPIDDLVLARMGVLGGMPGFRPAPVHVVHPLPSVGAAVLAALAVSAALLARERTGAGRALETTLMAGALLFHPKVVGERLAPHVFQTHPSGSAPFYSVYECADGEWVQLGCVHTGFIAAAAEVMGIRDVLDAPRFGGGQAPESPQAEEELRARLAEILRGRPYAEWAERFEAADIPHARARSTEEGLDDPQVRHNGMVVELEDPEVGPLVQMGVPVHLTATPGEVRGPRVLAPREPGGVPPGLDPVDRGSEPDPATELDPPLAGVRVLEITNLIAGPTGGRLLADLGADVIKLEPPTGDMSRPIGRTYFYSVNFNKRSIAVDTRKPEGRAVVQRIAASADALLANLRPGASERMGIGPEVNPRLIEAHITGYGWTGPYAHRPGIDPLAQALMGLERAQGGPENPPSFPAQLAPTDYTTGAMGAFGLVLALLARERTGIVQRVESNLLNGAIVLCSEWFTRYRGRPERPLPDRGQHGIGPFHRLYRVRDGWIYVAADRPDERRALLAALGLDGREGDPATADALAERLAARSRDEALAVVAAAGVPCAPALPGDSELFLDDPHAAANEMVATRDHPRVGRLRVAWQYVRLAGTRPTRGIPTPLLGEHTREVLAEVGYSAPEIERLYAERAVLTEDG